MRRRRSTDRAPAMTATPATRGSAPTRDRVVSRHGATPDRAELDHSREPLRHMNTGPLLTLPLDPRRQLRLQMNAGFGVSFKAQPSRWGLGCPRRARGRGHRRVARRRRRRVRAARRGGIMTSGGAPRRSWPPRVARQTTCAWIPTSRSRARGRPACRTSLLPPPRWLASIRASLQPRRAVTSPTASRSARRASHRPRAVPCRTRRVAATPTAGNLRRKLAGAARPGKRAALFRRTTHRRQDPGHRWRTTTIAASGLEVVPSRRRGGFAVDQIPDVSAVVVTADIGSRSGSHCRLHAGVPSSSGQP